MSSGTESTARGSQANGVSYGISRSAKIFKLNPNAPVFVPQAAPATVVGNGHGQQIKGDKVEMALVSRSEQKQLGSNCRELSAANHTELVIALTQPAEVAVHLQANVRDQ